MPEAELDHLFHDQGFVVLPGLADERSLSDLRVAADRLATRAALLKASRDGFVLEAPTGGWLAWQRGNPAFSGVLRSVADIQRRDQNFEEAVCRLALAHRFVGPAVRSEQVEFLTAYLWAKPAHVGSEKPWHQDMAYAPEWFKQRFLNVATVWIALDRATTDNGCLEFVRGSHRCGMLKHHGTAELEDNEARDKGAAEYYVDIAALQLRHGIVPIPLDAGSAVLFDGYTLHHSAANNSSSRRRAISLVFGYK